MKLIWFKRPDGRWNADCTCGASCCGIRFEERAFCEKRHYENAEDARKRGHNYPACGPKFPEVNVNMPGPWEFA